MENDHKTLINNNFRIWVCFYNGREYQNCISKWLLLLVDIADGFNSAGISAALRAAFVPECTFY